MQTLELSLDFFFHVEGSVNAEKLQSIKVGRRHVQGESKLCHAPQSVVFS